MEVDCGVYCEYDVELLHIYLTDLVLSNTYQQIYAI